MKSTKSYYAIIPANVRYDDELSPNAKLLYGEITALCNEHGYCSEPNSYFAKLYNCSKQSVVNWINQLVEKKYIIRKSFDGTFRVLILNENGGNRNDVPFL